VQHCLHDGTGKVWRVISLALQEPQKGPLAKKLTLIIVTNISGLNQCIRYMYNCSVLRGESDHEAIVLTNDVNLRGFLVCICSVRRLDVGHGA